jgi:DNA repair protein RecO (recombination protein O)
VLALMDALFRGNWAETENVAAPLRSQASGLVAAHLQWHLERQLRTLPLIERSRPHPAVGPESSVRQDGDRDSTTRTSNSA